MTGPHGIALDEEVSDHDMLLFQRLFKQQIGLHLPLPKKALLQSRLAGRLNELGFRHLGQYHALISSEAGAQERQRAIDLITTNETYFFREPKHFDVLRDYASAMQSRGQPLRVWSAASSSGEEAYSIAMVLADCMGDGQWDVIGSDISTRVLARARTGHYPLERTAHIPAPYLRRFCLKGTGTEQGTLLVERGLRSRVQFLQVNLNAPLPKLGTFDAIFLRNVMIYFNGDTKQQVVARVLSLLKPNGYFFIGHSESLHGITDLVQPVMPSVYRKL